MEGELEKKIFCRNNARARYPRKLFKQRGRVSRFRGWLQEERFLTLDLYSHLPCVVSVDADSCCRGSATIDQDISIYPWARTYASCFQPQQLLLMHSLLIPHFS